MSLPLLIRQIFNDLIISGPKQKFRFRGEPTGTFKLLNEFAPTALLSSKTELELGDSAQNSFVFRYVANSDTTTNTLGLFVVKNDTLDPEPVFTINQNTKEFLFKSGSKFTKSDGSTASIGSGSGGSSDFTQDDLDGTLQEAKDFTQTNKKWIYKYSVAESEVIHDWTDPDAPETVVPIVKHKLRKNQKMFVTGASDEVGNEINIYFNFIYGFGIYVKTPTTSTWYYFKVDALDIQNKKIVQLKDPEYDQDASTKKYTDDQDKIVKTWVANNYVTTVSLDNYVTSETFNTYVNTVANDTNSFDGELYSQVDANNKVHKSYIQDLTSRVRYLLKDSTVFEEYTSFRVPVEVGFGVGYSITDSSNYEWSLRERASDGSSSAKLSFKTVDGVKTIESPHAIVANGWVATEPLHLTTKGAVENSIDSSCPVGTIVLFVQNVNSGLLLPGGWLKCDGANFNSATYPELYQARSSSTLPNVTAPSGTYYIIKALKTSI